MSDAILKHYDGKKLLLRKALEIKKQMNCDFTLALREAERQHPELGRPTLKAETGLVGSGERQESGSVVVSGSVEILRNGARRAVELTGGGMTLTEAWARVREE